MCTTTDTTSAVSAVTADPVPAAAAAQGVDAPPSRWTALRVLLASMMATAAFVAVTVIAGVTPLITGTPSLTWARSTPSAALQLAAGIAAIGALAVAAGRGSARAQRLGFTRPTGDWLRPTVLVGIGVLVATVPFLGHYEASVGVAGGANHIVSYPATASALHLLTRVVAIPVLHELVWRSMLTGWLRTATGSRLVAILVAALVAAVAAPAYIVGLVTAGALSWLYLRTNSIWPCVAASSAAGLVVHMATTM